MRAHRFGQAWHWVGRGRASAPLTGALFALAITAASAAPSAPTVVTASGTVTGVAASYAATPYAPAFTVKNFLGIPYAAPPVGALRWMPPQKPANWTTPLAATQYSNICPQGFSELTFGGGNEDCLYINVQAPTDAAPGSKLPVMFWLHGGGLQTGSGEEYDGASLVREGHVIFVDFNYRLGLLGFFSHPALAAESAGADI
jgi:para-nitrobenzyl esterase